MVKDTFCPRVLSVSPSSNPSSPTAALGYCRVSTILQAEEGISLENQRSRIQTYCQYKGLELVDILEDAGISGGKNAARTGFISLLGAIERREIKAVVIYSLERLSRDMLTLFAFERFLNEYDIDLHTCEGTVDTSNPDGFLSFAMKSFMGEMEKRQIKCRTRSAMQHMKENGAVVGSIPYGYRRIGDQLEQEPYEQAIISEVNRLYKTGKTLSGICRSLEKHEKKSRNGKPFSLMQVKRIINGYKELYKHKSTEIGNTIKCFIQKVA